MFTLSRLSHAPRVAPTPAAPQMRAGNAAGSWIPAAPPALSHSPFPFLHSRRPVACSKGARHEPVAATPRRKPSPTILYSFAIAAALAASAGCSRGIDIGNDDATGHLNRHPVERYEVIATSHAPGPWNSIKAYIGYDVINTECVPMIPFIGQQHVPNTGIDVPMARVGDHTWKGYFYRDALQDEDYFKLGVCRWDVTSVGVSAVGKGVRFGWGGLLDELLHDSPEVSYFKKSAYGNRSLHYPAATLTAEDTEVQQQPDAYFVATIAVNEVKS